MVNKTNFFLLSLTFSLSKLKAFLWSENITACIVGGTFVTFPWKWPRILRDLICRPDQCRRLPRATWPLKGWFQLLRASWQGAFQAHRRQGSSHRHWIRADSHHPSKTRASRSAASSCFSVDAQHWRPIPRWQTVCKPLESRCPFLATRGWHS